MVNFGKAEREHQAEFRDTSPTISEQGRSPTDYKGQQYGYMLGLSCEDENLYWSIRGNDGARKFFAERRIKWWSHNGFDTAGNNGPTRNMASSQIMCVNFLLPLAEIDGALEAVVRAIDSDVERVVDIRYKGPAARVEFEWIGAPKSLEGVTTKGQNSTSVDAFVIADTGTSLRAYLMEWKYVEGEPPNRIDYGTGTAGETRRGRYSNLYYARSSSFSHKVPMNTLLYGDIYQLMRNRLLADRMVANAELGVSDAKVVLVVPEGNTAYMQPAYLSNRFPKLGTVSEVFRATLKDPNRAFATVSPSLLLEAVEQECGEAVSCWATYMRERYGL